LVRAPNFGDPTPAASPILRVIVAHRRDARTRALDVALLDYEVVEHHLPLRELARLPEDIAQQF